MTMVTHAVIFVYFGTLYSYRLALRSVRLRLYLPDDLSWRLPVLFYEIGCENISLGGAEMTTQVRRTRCGLVFEMQLTT
jgi:hypothetical protein